MIDVNTTVYGRHYSGKVKILKRRQWNKILAKLRGYFWEPCPLCGQMFGGHEKKGRWVMIPTYEPWRCEKICPACSTSNIHTKNLKEQIEETIKINSQ